MTVLVAALIGWAVVAVGASALLALVVRLRGRDDDEVVPAVGRRLRIVPAAVEVAPAAEVEVPGALDAAAEAAAEAAEEAQRAVRAAQGPVPAPRPAPVAPSR